MHYRPLGTTGLTVSALSLGAMNFGSWGSTSLEDCVPIVRRAIDAGINLIDTADVYSEGDSEAFLGQMMPDIDRDKIVLATKFNFPITSDVNERGGSRRWIIAACERSLRRLGTDYIDLYQMHRPDPGTDIDVTLGALTDLIRAGKIRYFGESTLQPSALVEARWTAERRGREYFATEQPPYSMLVRGAEAELFPLCQKYGMGVLTWSPLASGWLSGSWGPGQDNRSVRAARATHLFDMSKPGNQRRMDATGELAKLADEADIPLPKMALAFVLEHPAVSTVIVGPRTPEHLDAALAAADFSLPPDILDRIDEIVPPGTYLSTDDVGWVPPVLTDPARRRGARR
jgi:aryl-alcohol dehydrogenase-like predicted oxidoreductase